MHNRFILAAIAAACLALLAGSLNNLAIVYEQAGRNAEAEAWYLRSLAMRERALGKNHPEVADALNNLKITYMEQRRYADAEPLYLRTLEINQHVSGTQHPKVGNTLNNLGGTQLAK